MIEILKAVKEAEDKYLDTEKLDRVYGYIPCYDKVLEAVKRSGVKVENRGTSHFDWWADVTQGQVDRFLKRYYSAFLKGDEHV